MQVVTEARTFPLVVQRSSINAFGYGGANAHAILESAGSYFESVSNRQGNRIHDSQGPNGTSGPTGNQGTNGVIYHEKNRTQTQVNSEFNHKSGDIQRDVDGCRDRELVVVPISTTSEKSLQTRAADFQQRLSEGSADTQRDLVYTLAERRSHFRARLVKFAATNSDGRFELVRDIDVQLPADLATTSTPLPLGLIFTGQGAQYPMMGRELLTKNSGFQATIRSLDAILRSLPPEHSPDWSLERVILEPPETSRIHDVSRSQPVCTAVQVAIVDMLNDWGVLSSTQGVVGHSSGEIAAAYAAGLLSAKQAILVAYFRGYAVSRLQTEGAMLAASLDVEDAEKLLLDQGLTDTVCIACVNSPENVTFSGSIHGINTIAAELQGTQRRFARQLQTGGRAYHSYMMCEVGALYENLLVPYFTGCTEEPHGTTELDSATNTCEMYSSVGLDFDRSVHLSHHTNWPGYWRDNLEKPVQFFSALSELTSRTQKLHLIEVGPHPALKVPVEQIRVHMKLQRHHLPYSHTLVRKQEADVCMKKLAASLFLCGQDLKWNNVNLGLIVNGARPPHHFSNLAPYPWNYSAPPLWQEPRSSTETRNRTYPRHELLGSKQVAGNGIIGRWRNLLRLDEVPWLRDHKIEAQTVFPASGYLTMAVQALAQESNVSRDTDLGMNAPVFEMRNVSINAALVLPDGGTGQRGLIELHTTLSPKVLSTTTTSADWFEFTISSWVDGTTTLHCVGSIRLEICDANGNHIDTGYIALDGINRFQERPNLDDWYDRFQKAGLAFGPSFRSMARLRTNTDNACEMMCDTCISPPTAGSADSPTARYIALHPITVDACLQAALISVAKGDVNGAGAFLPVFIERCRIRIPSKISGRELGVIRAQSTKTSISTHRIDCVLRDAQGAVLVDYWQMRVIQYSAKVHPERQPSRHPCLQMVWKPDIQRLSAGASSQLGNYLLNFCKELQHKGSLLADDQYVATTGALLDLLAHKNPRIRILELGQTCECKSKLLLDLLGSDTDFPRYISWQSVKLDEKGLLMPEDSNEGPFDVVIAGRATGEEFWEHTGDYLTMMVANQGWIIARRSDMASTALKQDGFTVFEIADHLFALRQHQDKKVSFVVGKRVIIIVSMSFGNPFSREIRILKKYN